MKRLAKKAVVFLLIGVMMAGTCVITSHGVTKTSSEITIVFSHDTHSHLEKYAKIKTLIDRTKKENKSTFVVDAGDFSMGTPFQTIYTSEASELRMMGYVGYDVTTLGNHEFDYRSIGLSTMLSRAMYSGDKLPQLVISNIDWKTTLADKDQKENGEILKNTLKAYGAKDYVVLQRGGMKIACFGIFGKESASYAPESGTDFADPIETAKKTVKKIKKNEDVDMIVCLSHSGTNADDPDNSEDEQLAQNVDGIDLIVSGHSHTNFEKPLVENGTVIVSCGQYNTNLGIVSFSVKDGKVTLKDYKDTPLNGTIKDDKKTTKEVDKYKKLVNNLYFKKYGYTWDQKIATSNISFTNIDEFGLKQGEDTLGNLISDSYIYGVRNAEGSKYKTVDVAIAPAGVIRGSFTQGPITVADAFNALSLGTGKDGKAGYPLVSIYLTGKELKLVAEIDASVSDLMQPARLYNAGLVYKYNPHRAILNRAYDIHLVNSAGQAVKIDNDKLYRVVGDLYSCQMLGAVNTKSFGLLSLTPKDEKGNEVKNFEDHIIYDKDGGELKEWYALASYIDSFGGNMVPVKYGKTENRKELVDSKSIVDFFRSPNKFFGMEICLIILILALLALLILLIKKIVCRIKYGKGWKAKKRQMKNRQKEALIFGNRPNRYW